MTAYFQDRLRSRLYDLIINEFEKEKNGNGLTQATLARRIGKKPEQIHRWLGSPGNWTVETISNLLLGINGTELSMHVESIFKDNGVVIDNSSTQTTPHTLKYANAQLVVKEKPVPQVSFRQSGMAAVYTEAVSQSKI